MLYYQCYDVNEPSFPFTVRTGSMTTTRSQEEGSELQDWNFSKTSLKHKLVLSRASTMNSSTVMKIVL